MGCFMVEQPVILDNLAFHVHTCIHLHVQKDARFHAPYERSLIKKQETHAGGPSAPNKAPHEPIERTAVHLLHRRLNLQRPINQTTDHATNPHKAHKSPLTSPLK